MVGEEGGEGGLAAQLGVPAIGCRLPCTMVVPPDERMGWKQSPWMLKAAPSPTCVQSENRIVRPLSLLEASEIELVRAGLAASEPLSTS